MYLYAFDTRLCRNSGALILMNKVRALLSLYVNSLLTQRQEDGVNNKSRIRCLQSTEPLQ